MYEIWPAAAVIVYRIDVRDKREAAGEMHLPQKFPSTLSGFAPREGVVEYSQDRGSPPVSLCLPA
jgi:hypothetical protein